MGKKKLIDIVTMVTEEKLDSNGALRNVAVNDAWKRLRQNIEMASWKSADTVLQEMSGQLQKINMLKSMTSQFTKLKAAFQNPDQLVEEDDYIMKATPRDAKCQTPQLVRGTGEVNEDWISLSKCLLAVKSKLDSDGDVPDKIDVPSDATGEAKSCYNTIGFICDRYKRGVKDCDHLKKRIENGEKRIKELEKEKDEKDEHINKLTITVETLEKKHTGLKTEKIDNFKDQMKMKGLERQVQQKEAQLNKLKQEHKQVKDRLSAIVSKKGSDIDDALNPISASSVADQYHDIYTKEWKDMMSYLKSGGNDEKNAAAKLVQILQDAYQYARVIAQQQFQRLANDLVCFSSNLPADKLNLEDSDIKQLNCLRRQTSKLSCEHAKTAFITSLEESVAGETTLTLQEISDMMVYVEKCMEVCWFMCLQTQCLILDLSTVSGSAVDSSKYNVSTGKGKIVDYVLWPSMLKETDVLKKGLISVK